MMPRSWIFSVAVVSQVALAAASLSPSPALASDPLSPARQAVQWSENRLAEFDAAIGSLEQDAAKREGKIHANAVAAIADLRKQRDAYQAKVSEARSKITTWTDTQVVDARKSLDEASLIFHAKMGEYFDRTKADVTARKAALEAEFAARQKTWQKSIDELRTEAGKLDAKSRTAMNARIDALKLQMDGAKAQIERLRVASHTAWSAAARDYAHAERRFLDAYTSIRRSMKDAS